MAQDTPKPLIRNIAEVPWREFPNHFGAVEAAGVPETAVATSPLPHLED